MKSIYILVLFFSPLFAASQHYYNDIISTRDLSATAKTYLAQRVKSVTATGYDARGGKSTDFNEWQEFYPEEKMWRVATRNGQSVNRVTYRFDDQFRLISRRDSAMKAGSLTTYNYDPKGFITSIKIAAADTLSEFSETREHAWVYNTSGLPVTMWLITNGRDSVEYRFTSDAAGNVTDEQLFRRGTGLDRIYYYYNENNLLTDIVRYDRRTKKLLPDAMFEYDEKDRVIQKITTLSATNRDYLIWRYVINEKGLRKTEALFNKQKELSGRIEYSFTYLP